LSTDGDTSEESAALTMQTATYDDGGSGAKLKWKLRQLERHAIERRWMMV